MDQQQLDKVREAIEKSGLVLRGCPLCGQKRFSVEGIVAPNMWEQGNIQIGGKVVPLLLVICQNCGHAIHFAAKKIGALE
ncbi:MAG: hypothetical protein HN348_10695 [Proteobacteria bacterium]|jgi:hypothetical protein|nr:hypothetical protein [Pseudomonadota bacterium]